MESNLKEIKDNGNLKNVGLCIDEVVEECKLFYFAGQETTSTLLVWTMIVLSMHRDWQEKAREEVLQVIGRKTSDFDGLSHLNIVTMIPYEVLRLYPPAFSLIRATYKKMKLGDILLPAGVQLDMKITRTRGLMWIKTRLPQMMILDLWEHPELMSLCL